MQAITNTVVYVIQKSNKYGLKQVLAREVGSLIVVYVIQKSNKYGLKQGPMPGQLQTSGCVCHSKK